MSDILHCRLPAELLSKIDGQVEQLRAGGADAELASRSGVARVLIARGLGEGDDDNVVNHMVLRAGALYLRRLMAQAKNSPVKKAGKRKRR